MLKNAYLLAKIGADTAENELIFAEILPIDWLRRSMNLRTSMIASTTTALGLVHGLALDNVKL